VKCKGCHDSRPRGGHGGRDPKDPRLGKKLLILKPVSPEGKDEAGYVVAVDTVRWRRERVIAVSAAPPAWRRAAEHPVDTAIVGIIDEVSMDGHVPAVVGCVWATVKNQA
jgi:microcompartment protein CcmK/EutM